MLKIFVWLLRIPAVALAGLGLIFLASALSRTGDTDPVFLVVFGLGLVLIGAVIWGTSSLIGRLARPQGTKRPFSP